MRYDSGRIVQVKIGKFCSTPDCDGFVYDQEVARNQGKPDCHQLKTSVTLHIDQMMRIETSEPGAMLWKEDRLPGVKKETKPTLRGKWKSVFSGRHMDNVQKETHGRKGRSGQTSSKGSGSKQESYVDKSEIPCRFNFC